jgi:protein-disulfide isomerase
MKVWSKYSAILLVAPLFLGGCFSPSQEQVDLAIQKEMQKREEEKRRVYGYIDEYLREKGLGDGILKRSWRNPASDQGLLDSAKIKEILTRENLESSPMIGPKTAPVTFVLFTDFPCGPCVAAHIELMALLKEEKFKKKIRIIYKFYPATNMANISRLSAQAAIAAFALGRFEDLVSQLYSSQRFDGSSLVRTATDLNMDPNVFQRHMHLQKTLERLDKDQDDFRKLRLKGTPTLFINGLEYPDPITKESLEGPVADILKIPRQ